MTTRLAALLAASTVLLAAPAWAQDPDYGVNNGSWADNGVCDDPRFTGAGMAPSVSEAGIRTDASDCAAAYLRGDIDYVGEGQATQVQAAPPAAAGGVDFGADTSPWANDGECDDPRFTGPGMAASTVESDSMADATDCRMAFEAGTVQLIEGQATPPAAPTPTPTPTPGVKGAQTTPPAAPATTPAPAAAPMQVNFGDDSSQWANDGECDDRRFVGQGMATSLEWANAGRDATDCRGLYDAGSIRLWNPIEAQAATQCAAIDFGDDQSEWALNNVCDDPRFEGLGMDSVVNPSESGHDATDCLQLCAYGVVSLRDY